VNHAKIKIKINAVAIIIASIVAIVAIANIAAIATNKLFVV
jgi:hypothetical protein